VSEQASSNQRFTALPTAEEYKIFRELYAQTYPVRPLMNAIDILSAALRGMVTFRDDKDHWDALTDYGIKIALDAAYDRARKALREAAPPGETVAGTPE